MLNNHYAAQGAFQAVSFHRALKALPEYSGLLLLPSASPHT